MTQDDKTANARNLSGRWTVAGMLAFGVTAVAILWLYWELHTAPFRPLREAILAEYPKSAPRVEGGRQSISKGTPSLLRVVMKVDFDPKAGEAAERVERLVDRVAELAEEHAALRSYDRLEVHLYWPEAEKELHQRTVVREVAR